MSNVVDGLPEALRLLLAANLWSSRGEEDDRIPRSVARQWDPGAYGIHLHSPIKLSDEVDGNRTFWEEHGALSTIDADAYAIIGDFGLGSDSPIVVALNRSPPHVMRLAWPTSLDEAGGGNRWEVIADDFDMFVSIIFPNRPGTSP